MAAAISDRLQRFLSVNMTNVAQLELLLHVRSAPDHWWTPDAVAAPLTTRPAVAARDFSHLHERGLVERAQGEPPRYRYGPGELAPVVDEVADLYERRRRAVVDAIFAEPHDAVASLADAFRLRRT